MSLAQSEDGGCCRLGLPLPRTHVQRVCTPRPMGPGALAAPTYSCRALGLASRLLQSKPTWPSCIPSRVRVRHVTEQVPPLLRILSNPIPEGCVPASFQGPPEPCRGPRPRLTATPACSPPAPLPPCCSSGRQTRSWSRALATDILTFWTVFFPHALHVCSVLCFHEAPPTACLML